MSKDRHTTIDEIHDLRIGHPRASLLTELMLLFQSPPIDVLRIFGIANQLNTNRTADLHHRLTDGSKRRAD